MDRKAQLASAWESKGALVIRVSEVVLRIEVEEAIQSGLLLIQLKLYVRHVVHLIYPAWAKPVRVTLPELIVIPLLNLITLQIKEVLFEVRSQVFIKMHAFDRHVDERVLCVAVVQINFCVVHHLLVKACDS